MSLSAVIPEIAGPFDRVTAVDDVSMIMALPPCCRGGGCMNMTSSMSSTSSMEDAPREAGAIEAAADSIGLSVGAQAQLNRRFAKTYGTASTRAVFATFIEKLLLESPRKRAEDVRAINAQYGALS